MTLYGAAAVVNLRLANGSYFVAGKELSCFTDEEMRAAGKHKVVPFLLESKLRERGVRFHPGAADSDIPRVSHATPTMVTRPAHAEIPTFAVPCKALAEVGTQVLEPSVGAVEQAAAATDPRSDVGAKVHPRTSKKSAPCVEKMLKTLRRDLNCRRAI